MEYINSYRDSLTADILPGYDDALYHHGILGMHWGVRRYQNPDGSLTAAGKKRRKEGGLSDRQKALLAAGAVGLAGTAAYIYANKGRNGTTNEDDETLKEMDKELEDLKKERADISSKVSKEIEKTEDLLEKVKSMDVPADARTEESAKKLDDILRKYSDKEFLKQEWDKKKREDELRSRIHHTNSLIKSEMQEPTKRQRKSIQGKYSAEEFRDMDITGDKLGKLKLATLHAELSPYEDDRLSGDKWIDRAMEEYRANDKYRKYRDKALLRYGPEKFRDCAILGGIKPQSLSAYEDIFKILEDGRSSADGYGIFKRPI